MTTCVPVCEMKNTAAFSSMVEHADEPVIVTKNGREAFAVMTMAQLDALRLEASRARLYEVIDRAEEQVAAGDTADARSSIEAARKRYGL